MEDLPGPVADLLALPESARSIGPFALTRQLGRGGFAPVWLAEERYAGTELRTVAVKLFALREGRGAEHEGGARSILAEARALCQVEHPNIVRFLSIAVDEQRRLMGLVTEYLGGSPLDRLLAERGPLATSEVIEVGIAVASALAAAHRSGVVHRDVKPANIIRVASGYKLIDFGLARAARAATSEGIPFRACDVPIARASGASDTMMGWSSTEIERTVEVTVAAGTLGYVDPECVARNLSANPVSDLYALGATLYELASGALPARSGNVLRGDVLDGRKRSPSLRSVVSEVPTELSEIVDALLSPARSARPQSAEWVATRLQSARRALTGRAQKLPPDEVGPFRGLGRFEADDQGVYFGRAIEIAQALQVLRVRGLVALLGPSGSGKSSLARAGVLPAVVEGQLGSWPEHWKAVVVTPSGNAAASVLNGMKSVLEGKAPESPSELLAALGDHVQAKGEGVVLLVDQLEELATVSDEVGRDWLVELLVRVGEQPFPGVRVVVTARRDLLDPLLALSGLGRALLPNAVLVEPMTALAWSEALEQAFSAYGYAWENETLRDAVTRDIERAASAMPLVQFALARLWETRDATRRVLTLRAFEAMGGVAGALAQHAELTLARVARDAPGGEDGVRRVLLLLTTPQGTRATRQQAEIEQATRAPAGPILEAFESARLVVRLPSGYTLAHEVLLDEWQRFHAWVAAARGARLLVEELEHDAARFTSDREAVPVWRRRRLLLALDTLERESLEPSPQGRAFLDAGLGAERKRRFTLTAMIVALAGLTAGGAGLYLRAVQQEKARTEVALQRELQSREIAESRTREVQRAQQRIDELLRDIENSPEKREVLALQAQIRGTTEKTDPKVAPASVRSRPATEPEPKTHASSASPPEPPRMRVLDEW
jgi:serine/threonine protein kinase